MPLVAAVPPAPTDLAWRVIGLVNLYRLLIPPSLYALYVYFGVSDADRFSASSGAVPLDVHRLFRRGHSHRRRRPSPAAQFACHHVRARDGRCGRDQPASASRAAASPAASASCSWCRSARWRCWRTTATRSCSPRWRRWRCSRSRLAATSPGTAERFRLSRRRHPRRHRLPGGAARLADRAPAARHRSHGAAPAGRPRQPRAAVAIHRAEPAREHRGRRPRESHPPHQRIRGARCSAIAAPIRARCSAKPRRSCSIYSRPGGQRTAVSGRAVADLRRGRRRPRDPAAFRARSAASEPSPVIVFLEDTELLAAKIQQSKLAGLGPPVRQHRPRNPQSGGRHEPRRAAAGRVRVAVGTKTSGSPRSCAPTAIACGRSSKT